MCGIFRKTRKRGEVELKYVADCLIKVLIVSTLILVSGAPPAYAVERPKIPYAATAKTLDGKIASLAAHKGKLVFLTVWRTDCRACIFEIPILNRIQQEYSAEDFTVIGLSMDRGKDDFVKKVVEMKEINYPIWLGYGQPLSRYTYTQYLPTLFVIGPEGEVLGYMIGAFMSYEHAMAVIGHARNLVKEKKVAE